jgi:uncharacterized protein YndB with AHSA1/START domain
MGRSRSVRDKTSQRVFQEENAILSKADGKPILTVRREIRASAERLFDAWLDPASVARWMCPGDIERADAQIDPKVDGQFRIVMHGKETLHVHTGTYRVIDRPRRLVFTWASSATRQIETLVTVEFHVRAATTEVVLTQEDLPDEVSFQQHAEGWGQILELLAMTIRRANA